MEPQDAPKEQLMRPRIRKAIGQRQPARKIRAGSERANREKTAARPTGDANGHDDKEKRLRYAKIDPLSIANGPGCRVAVFVTGCRNACENCFNQKEQDFDYGEKFTDDTIRNVLELMSTAHTSGLTILGGEPMEPENQPEVLRLTQAVRERYNHDRTIWLFTGFTYERLISKESRSCTESLRPLLDTLDVLVDGPFVQRLSSPLLRFRGSSNQRLIDLAAMRAKNTPEIIEWDDGLKRGKI